MAPGTRPRDGRRTLSPTSNPIATQDWVQIAGTLVYLWIFAASWVTFALSFLIGHAIIPSLVHTHHVPRSVSAVRPVFYLISLAGAAGAVFAIVSWLNWLPVIYRIFPRVVI